MNKLIYFLSIFFSLNCFSQENLLDTTYGLNSGYTNFAFYNGSQPTGGLQIQSTIKLPDGKILAVGVRLIARFTANGVLDQTFNGVGYKLLSSGNYGQIESAKDGNFIIVDGSSGGQLQKIDSDGNFVTSFTTFNESGNYGNIFIDNSGKIYLLIQNNNVFSIARILPNGILDTSFGINGKISLNPNYYYGKILLNSNNEIFIAGKQQISQTNRNIIVTKISSNGLIDTTFGTNGSFIYPGGEYVGDASFIEILDDGKILGLTSGSLCNGNNCFGLIMYRLLPNGVLDTSFKNAGTFVLPIQSNSTPSELKRHQDGDYIVSGTGLRTMYAIKMDSDANLDSSFGLNGKIITPELSASGYPAYNNGFELYGNSIVLAGIYSFWYGAQLRYAGTVRKYFFDASSLNTSEIHTQKNIRIFPNPVKDYINIQIEESINGFEIYDQNGRKLISSKMKLSKNEIDVKSLSPGAYVLRLELTNKNVSIKFLKN